VISDVGRALRTLLRPHLPAAAIHLSRPGPSSTPRNLGVPLSGTPRSDTPRNLGVPASSESDLGVPATNGPTADSDTPRSLGVPASSESDLGVPRSDGFDSDRDRDGDGVEPAVHLVLCWLSEDPDGQQSGIRDVRAEDGTLLGRQAPARRYRLRYLVTARAETVEAEHELLDAVLIAVSGLDSLPPDCLPKGLADTGLPVLLRVCPEPAIASSGIPEHAGFELDISAPLLPPLQTELAPPASELAVGMRRPMPQRHGEPAPAGNGRQWRRARVTEE